jgi:hypothetical protein
VAAGGCEEAGKQGQDADEAHKNLGYQDERFLFWRLLRAPSQT